MARTIPGQRTRGPGRTHAGRGIAHGPGQFNSADRTRSSAARGIRPGRSEDHRDFQGPIGDPRVASRCASRFAPMTMVMGRENGLFWVLDGMSLPANRLSPPQEFAPRTDKLPMNDPTPVWKRLVPRLLGIGRPGSQEARPFLAAVAGGLIAWGTAIAGIAVVDVIVRQVLLEDLRTNLARTAAGTAAVSSTPSVITAPTDCRSLTASGSFPRSSPQSTRGSLRNRGRCLRDTPRQCEHPARIPTRSL